MRCGWLQNPRMAWSPEADIAAAAARLIVDEGLDYASAKRKAARVLGENARRMPSDEQVEEQVREHLAIFHAQTQPRELALLRETALAWMQRLAAWNPHLAGAAWRGTATARSVLYIELYADDPKMAQIELANLGVDGHAPDRQTRGRDVAVLATMQRVRGLDDAVAIEFAVHDADDLRGALRPDARGRRWRGDARALALLIDAERAAAQAPP
jgi:hypothetical protein